MLPCWGLREPRSIGGPHEPGAPGPLGPPGGPMGPQGPSQGLRGGPMGPKGPPRASGGVPWVPKGPPRVPWAPMGPHPWGSPWAPPGAPGEGSCLSPRAVCSATLETRATFTCFTHGRYAYLPGWIHGQACPSCIFIVLSSFGDPLATQPRLARYLPTGPAISMFSQVWFTSLLVVLRL